MTGFEPFLSYKYNPSGSIAKKLDGKIVSGRKVISKILPVKHKEVQTLLDSYIEEYKPISVISLGLKGTIGCIALERIAINRYYYRDQNSETDEPLHEGEPAALFSTLPLNKIKDALQEQGIPAEFSFYPDTYVSNEVFYEVMRASGRLGIKRAGFIHIPLTHQQVVGMNQHYAIRERIPSMDEKTIYKAIKVLIDVTLE